jgi:putative membrane protein
MGFESLVGTAIFWIVLIFLAVIFGRRLFTTNRPDQYHPQPTARQILEQRYAKGEISREEYLAILKRI